jgi:hypothetical protein
MRTNTLKLCLIFIFLCGISLPAQNGPTPKTVVGSSEIADGSINTSKLADDAVNADKLDETGDYNANTITLADKVQAAWADIRGDIYASGSLEIAGDADIGGDLSGVNASFNSLETPSVTMRAIENSTYGYSRFVSFPSSITTAGPKTITFRRSVAEARVMHMTISFSGYADSIAAPVTKTVLFSFSWDSDGTIANIASDTTDLGGGSDIDIALTASGTTDIGIDITNNGGSNVLTSTVSVEFLGGRGSRMSYIGVE